jgi:hypothetical protein
MVEHKRKVQPRNSARYLVGNRGEGNPIGICDCGVDQYSVNSSFPDSTSPPDDSGTSVASSAKAKKAEKIRISNNWVRCGGCGRQLHSECARRLKRGPSLACAMCAGNWARLAKYCKTPIRKGIGPRTPCGTVPKRKWTEAEDASLRAAVEAHGEEWSVVGEQVAGRNCKQCRDRWKILQQRQRFAEAVKSTEAIKATEEANTAEAVDVNEGVQTSKGATHDTCEESTVGNQCKRNPLCIRPARHAGLCAFRLEPDRTDSVEATRILARHFPDPNTLDIDNLVPLPTARTQTGYLGVYPGRKGRFQAQVLHRAIGVPPPMGPCTSNWQLKCALS